MSLLGKRSSLFTSTHDPAGDSLSVWLRSSEFSGSGITFDWPGKASAGTSAANGFGHAVANEVESPSTTFDGYASAYWHNTAGQPQLDTTASGKMLRADLLGQGDATSASYTACYVVQPVSSNRYDVSSGQTGLGNPGFLGEQAEYFLHAMMSDAGTCKVGVSHYDSVGATTGGTAPLVWPGGFGTWGLLWFSYTDGGTIYTRLKTVGNAVVTATETIAIPRIPAAWATQAEIGSMGGGGDVGELRMVEMMVWAGQALSAAQIATREQGYFKARYPTLGL